MFAVHFNDSSKHKLKRLPSATNVKKLIATVHGIEKMNFLLIDLLKLLGVIVLLGVLSSCFIGQILGGISVQTIHLLLLLLFMSATGVIFSKVTKFSNSKEVVFLKKCGFDDKELYMYLLFRLRNTAIVVSGIYAAVFFYNKFHNLTWMSFVYCITGAIFTFLLVFLLSTLYHVLLKTRVRIIANVSLGIFVVGAIICGNNQVVYSEHLFANFHKTVESIANNFVLNFVVVNIVLPSKLQLISLVALSVTVICFCTDKIFLVDRYLKTAHKQGKAHVKTKPTRQSSFFNFIMRDIRFLIRYPLFIVVQFVHVAFACFGIYYSSDMMIKAGVIVFAVLGTLLTQNLLEIDSRISSLYRKLPLPFTKFLLYRVVSASAVSTAVPIVVLIMSMFTHRISFNEFCLFILASILVTGLLCLYWTSIILYFFPVVHRSNIPLILGAFIPVLLFVAIPLGIRKGHKNWGKWD